MMLPGTAQTEKRFRLRWRLEFSDGKPPVFGGWDSGTHAEACFKKTENLLFAVIEGEENGTWKIERLAEMGGQDFIEFKWTIVGWIPGHIPGPEIRSPARLLGMKIVGRDDTVEIFLNGKGRIVPTDEKDKRGFVEANRV